MNAFWVLTPHLKCSVCMCVGTHFPSTCFIVGGTSIEYTLLAHYPPSSVPAPDPKVAYLMGSSRRRTRLARPGSPWCRARLSEESCHPGVVCSCHLVLQRGSANCHLYLNKWLHQFQNRQCRSSMPRSKATSYHAWAFTHVKLTESSSNVLLAPSPFHRWACWDSEKQLNCSCQLLVTSFWTAPSSWVGYAYETCEFLSHIWCWLPKQAVAQALPGSRLGLDKLICTSNQHSTPPLRTQDWLATKNTMWSQIYIIHFSSYMCLL